MGLRRQLLRWLKSPRDNAPGDAHLPTKSQIDLTEDEQKIIRTVQANIGYKFANPLLLRRALVHRSHAHVVGESRISSNERLEFLGDSILGAVVSEDIFRLHRNLEEGDLTKMKARLVCGATLSIVARELGLGKCILMSQGEEATGGRERASILADSVESILGAVYLDGGFEKARLAVERWILEDRSRFLDDELLGNNKSHLQELVQSRLKVPPRYSIREVTGPDHDRHYFVEVSLRGKVLGEGQGANKKTAEQVAAGEALAAIANDNTLLDPDGDEND
jgi:ribonuclease III